MLTEIKYKTFDELLDSVRIDLRTYDLEGMIDAQQLLKVAIRVNYELGLKINPSRSKVINVVNGKARLPEDFDVLNFALVCANKNIIAYPPETKYSYKTYCQGIIDGIELAQDVARAQASMVKLFSTVTDIVQGDNLIVHNLDTKDFIVQAIDSNNHVLSFDVEYVTNNSIKIISQVPTTLVDIKVTLIGGMSGYQSYTTYSDLSTCNDGTVTPRCSNAQLTENCSVVCKKDNFTYEYATLLPLHIDKTKSSSYDVPNIKVDSRQYYTAVIKNGFISTNFPDGEIYVNYQSLMEDDDGNLLVMDNPYTNEFYEYALKQRIFENLLMSNEPVTNQLGLVEQRLRSARNNALSFVNTPDFGEMKKVWEMNRKAQYHKFYNMFKR